MPRRSTSLTVLSTAAVFAAVAGAPRAADAAVVFADNFNNVANGATINGRTPDQTVNGAKWAAPAGNFAGNGAGALAPNTATASTIGLDLGGGYLSANKGVYELSADVTQPSGVASQSWIGLGFMQGVTGTAALDPVRNMVDNGGAPWMIFRLNGQVNVYGGVGTSNLLVSTATDAFARGTVQNLRLVLDTSGEQWTLDAFVGATQLDLNAAAAGNSYTFAAGANPAASRYVGLSTGNNGTGAVATVDNFQLTGPVPEPGIAGLAVAAVALATRRGRRKTPAH